MKNKKLISKLGYRDDSPYKDKPFIDINTPTGEIDMSKTGIPLWANGRILPPYSGKHQFDTNVVREIPLAQGGGSRKAPSRKGVRLNYDEEGNVIGESSHIMKTETLDGIHWFSFPTLFQNEDGSWLDMSEESDKDWKPAMLEAKKRGELIHFGADKEEALAFGEGSWKDLEYEELELTDEEIEEYRRGGHVVEELPKAQTGYVSQNDSINHQRDKTLFYEELQGGSRGNPLPWYGTDAAKEKYDRDVKPNLSNYSSAIEKGEAGDFLYNTGKNPSRYALQEYYKKYEKDELDRNGKWSGRNGLSDAEYAKLYKEKISGLKENDRRLLMNNGRDWYYQNTYNDPLKYKNKPYNAKTNPHVGVAGVDYWSKTSDGKGRFTYAKGDDGTMSPQYANTWYGRIHNTNDYTEFNKDVYNKNLKQKPENVKYIHPTKRKHGGELPKAQNAGEVVSKVARAAAGPWFFDKFISNPTKTTNNSTETGYLENRRSIDNEDLRIKGKTFETNNIMSQNAMKFIRDYYDSPMYKEMLEKESPMNAEFIANARNSNLEDFNVFTHDTHEAHEDSGGYSESGSGDIHVMPSNAKDPQTYVHEISHSSDRPMWLKDGFINNLSSKNLKNIASNIITNAVIPGLGNLSLLAESWNKPENADVVTDYLQTNNFFSPNESTRIIPKSSIALTKKLRKAQEEKQIYSEKEEKKFKDENWDDYIAKPTEIRARLNEIRWFGKTKNIYDPFTEKVDNDALLQLQKTRSFQDLKSVYNDDQIKQMLNEISEAPSDENKNINLAQIGGEYMDLDLTEDQIKNYQKGGFVIEDLPEYQAPPGQVTIGDKVYDTTSNKYRKLIESGKVKPYTTDTESGIGAFDYGNLPDVEITAPTQEAVDMAKSAFNRSKQGQAKQQGIQNFLSNQYYPETGNPAVKDLVQSMGESIIKDPNNLSYYPGAGELYDAGHLGHSLRQGNYKDAAFDAAGFTLPFVGGKAIKKFAEPIIDKFKGIRKYGNEDALEGLQIAQNELDYMKSLGKELDDKHNYFDYTTLTPKNAKFHGVNYGRPIAEVELPTGNTQLFYKSTGTAGKAGSGVGGTTEGLWQPYGGHANMPNSSFGRGEGVSKDWFIKDGGYKDWYGSNAFRDISGNLERLALEGKWDMSDFIKASEKNLKYGGNIPIPTHQKPPGEVRELLNSLPNSYPEKGNPAIDMLDLDVFGTLNKFFVEPAKRVIQDPIGTVKSIGNTAADVASFFNPLSVGSAEPLIESMVGEDINFGGDGNNAFGTPYWTDNALALDAAVIAPALRVIGKGASSTFKALTKMPNKSVPLNKVIHPIDYNPVTGKPNAYPEPYLMSRQKPFSKEDDIINSFYSPEKRSELYKQNTIKYDPQGNIIPNKTFKSEIDWGKWNKEIPDNKPLMKEYDAIEQSSKANKTWMKNADGSAFKGTPEQFVQVRSGNFQKAFPNSLLDDAGNPLINYHGSGSKFNAFDESKFYSGEYGKGVYTSPDKEAIIKSYANTAKKRTQKMAGKSGTDSPTPNLYELYVNSKNPHTTDDILDWRNWGKRIDELPSIADWKASDFGKKMLSENAWMKTDDDIISFIRNSTPRNPVKESFIDQGGDFLRAIDTPLQEGVTPFWNQMKSAIGNNGMFDMSNPNIYKALFPAAIGTGTILSQEEDGGEIGYKTKLEIEDLINQGYDIEYLD